MAGGGPPEGRARGSRSALIVATDEYQDPGLRELRAPAADARALAAVLSNPEIAGFEVTTLLNEPAYVVNEAVEEFLTYRSPEDLLLLHFSCHGIKDQQGELYFAMSNTKLRLLGATGVSANFVNSRMSQSRSRRIVLFLDCCYAGAFERGMRPRAGALLDLEERFSGRGRAVITASGALEYAFEGGELTEAGDQAPSVFTSAMVRGLSTGEADRDQDGYVDLDELYDYVYDAVHEVSPQQNPGKWTFGVQGELVLARRPTPVTEPVPLPAELHDFLTSPLAGVRAGAVGELARLVSGRHQGLALAARQALEALANDDSRSVSAAATAALAEAPPPATPEGPGTPPLPSTGPTAVTSSAPRSPAPGSLPASQPPASHDEPSRGRERRERRWWPPTRRAWLGLAALVAVLIVGGTAAWWIPAKDQHQASIPASFEGSWQGLHGPYNATFTLRLVEGLTKGELSSGSSSCYDGTVTVTDATDSRLEMRLAPLGKKCNPWTIVFTHLSQGDLKMSVDPTPRYYVEQAFEVRFTQQG